MIKQFLVLIAIAILYVGCCNPKELGYIPMDSSTLAINPIVEFETLNYKDNFGNFVQFKCLKRSRTLKKQRDCDECCADYYTVEVNDYTQLESVDLSTRMYVSIVNNYYYGVKDGSPEMVCGWSSSNNSNVVSSSYSGYINIDSMEYNARKGNYFADSIMLREKEFRNVYKLACKQTMPNVQAVDTIYYNFTKGIVGMKRNGVNLWVRE